MHRTGDRCRYGAKPLIGVLHSISALVALLHQLQAEEEGEGGFAALVLFDVPVCPPGRTVDDNVEIGAACRFASGYRGSTSAIRTPGVEDQSGC